MYVDGSGDGMGGWGVGGGRRLLRVAEAGRSYRAVLPCGLTVRSYCAVLLCGLTVRAILLRPAPHEKLGGLSDK